MVEILQWGKDILDVTNKEPQFQVYSLITYCDTKKPRTIIITYLLLISSLVNIYVVSFIALPKVIPSALSLFTVNKITKRKMSKVYPAVGVCIPTLNESCYDVWSPSLAPCLYNFSSPLQSTQGEQPEKETCSVCAQQNGLLLSMALSSNALEKLKETHITFPLHGHFTKASGI